MRNRRLPEQRVRHREHGEGYDEEADTAIRERCTSQYHRCDSTRLSQPLGYSASHGKRRSAIIHELAEYAPQQKEREKIHDETSRALHKGQRPFGEYRLSREGGCHNRRRRRRQQQGVAPKGEEDEQAESDQDTEQFESVTAHDTPFRRAGNP
jgi:hypothetical protein